LCSMGHPRGLTLTEISQAPNDKYHTTHSHVESENTEGTEESEMGGAGGGGVGRVLVKGPGDPSYKMVPVVCH
jgi:hypothetical protein